MSLLPGHRTAYLSCRLIVMARYPVPLYQVSPQLLLSSLSGYLLQPQQQHFTLVLGTGSLLEWCRMRSATRLLGWEARIYLVSHLCCYDSASFDRNELVTRVKHHQGALCGQETNLGILCPGRHMNHQVQPRSEVARLVDRWSHFIVSLSQTLRWKDRSAFVQISLAKVAPLLFGAQVFPFHNQTMDILQVFSFELDALTTCDVRCLCFDTRASIAPSEPDQQKQHSHVVLCSSLRDHVAWSLDLTRQSSALDWDRAGSLMSFQSNTWDSHADTDNSLHLVLLGWSELLRVSLAHFIWVRQVAGRLLGLALWVLGIWLERGGCR